MRCCSNVLGTVVSLYVQVRGTGPATRPIPSRRSGIRSCSDRAGWRTRDTQHRPPREDPWLSCTDSACETCKCHGSHSGWPGPAAQQRCHFLATVRLHHGCCRAMILHCGLFLVAVQDRGARFRCLISRCGLSPLVQERLFHLRYMTRTSYLRLLCMHMCRQAISIWTRSVLLPREVLASSILYPEANGWPWRECVTFFQQLSQVMVSVVIAWPSYSLFDICGSGKWCQRCHLEHVSASNVLGTSKWHSVVILCTDSISRRIYACSNLEVRSRACIPGQWFSVNELVSLQHKEHSGVAEDQWRSGGQSFRKLFLHNSALCRHLC